MYRLKLVEMLKEAIILDNAQVNTSFISNEIPLKLLVTHL